jgi:glycerol kinase
VAFQTRDLVDAMRADWPEATETVLRVDGGMVASDWTMQFLADLLGAPVDRPSVRETTALGPRGSPGCRPGSARRRVRRRRIGGSTAASCPP